MMRKKQSQFVKDVALLIEYCRANEVDLTFGEAFRTADQQAIHLRDGKTKVKHSRHQDRLAVDFNFFINGKLTYDKAKLQHIGNFWENLRPSNKWGGNWKTFQDTPHFQSS
jgi:hypothetical protein